MRPLIRALKGLILLPLLIQLGEAMQRVSASYLGEGVVAASEFARFLTDTCVTLLAVPVGFAGLTVLSATSTKVEDVAKRVKQLTPLLIMAGVPLAAFLACNSRAVVTVVYSRGNFDSGSVATTSVLVAGLAVGLWAQMLSYVFIKNYSATLRTRRIAVMSGIATISGILTMVAAIPLDNVFVLGLGGGVSGILLLALCTIELRIVPFVAGWIARVVPGGIAPVAVSLWLSPESITEFMTVAVASATCWFFYYGASQATRCELARLLPARFRRRVSDAQEGL
jgi:putative peptidoglycan lipid II flippase